MRFPTTNKVHRDINQSFGENAQLLEERMRQVNWQFFLKFYAAALGIILVTIFSLIVVVKAGLAIF